MGTNLQAADALPEMPTPDTGSHEADAKPALTPASSESRIIPINGAGLRPDAPCGDQAERPAMAAGPEPDAGVTEMAVALEAYQLAGRIQGRPLKRLLDITVSLTVLIFLLPLLVLVGLLVRAHDRGPVFFSHTRIGAHGRAFNCLKFRTMAVDAEARLAELLASDADAAAEWHAQRKLKHDPRVTGLGRFLRRSSIDELPQLLNVLIGDMSLVGPRPVVIEDLELHGADVVHYLSNRPGVTGLWQISGRTDTDYGTRVALDRAYSEKRSFRGDLVILLKTVPKVLFGKGAY